MDHGPNFSGLRVVATSSDLRFNISGSRVVATPSDLRFNISGLVLARGTANLRFGDPAELQRITCRGDTQEP